MKQCNSAERHPRYNVTENNERLRELVTNAFRSRDDYKDFKAASDCVKSGLCVLIHLRYQCFHVVVFLKILLTDRAPALTTGLWYLHQTADIIQKHHGNL